MDNEESKDSGLNLPLATIALSQGASPEFAICSPIDPNQPPFVSESAPVSEEAWQELNRPLPPNEEAAGRL